MLHQYNKRLYCAFAIYAPSDEAQEWSKSTWEPINYGKFFSLFQLDIITSIQ